MSDDHIGVKVNGVLYVKLEDARKLREGWDKADERIEAQAAEMAALQARVAVLEEALRFYADPFKYTDIHGDDVRVPHFYSETDFGETARVALGLDKPWSLQP